MEDEESIFCSKACEEAFFPHLTVGRPQQLCVICKEMHEPYEAKDFYWDGSALTMTIHPPCHPEGVQARFEGAYIQSCKVSYGKDQTGIIEEVPLSYEPFMSKEDS